MQVIILFDLKVDQCGNMEFIPYDSANQIKADRKRERLHIPDHNFLSNTFVLNKII